MLAKGKEFYIPHKAVIRENAATTTMHIVYDASGCDAKDTAPSLNECLETGTPLQNQIWRVLVRGRFHFPRKYVRYVLRVPCLVWAHHPFFLGASFSITWKFLARLS